MLPVLIGSLLMGCASQSALSSSDTGTADTGTLDTGTPDTGTPDTGTPDTGDIQGEITIGRVGEIHVLHNADRGRAVFADVMLIGDDRVVVTYQLAGDTFCAGKSLYFQEFDRDLTPVKAETLAIDVTVEGNVFRQSSMSPGDLGDHKFTVLDDTIFMLTTVPGQTQCRLLRFDADFNPIDDLFDDASLARVGDEGEEDRLLDMGFGNDGTHLYAQFYNQPMDSPPSSWGAQIYKLSSDGSPVDEAVVQPEQGTFLTGTSIVFVPQGQMGASEDILQNFSPNMDYGSSQLSGIHTFSVRASDLSLVEGSTRTIAESDLDLYFPTGADFNEKHQIWVVGYTQEISAGVHGSQVRGADACRGTAQPSGEEYRELGPSFITVYDADWNELQTFLLNDGDYAFRVMLETDGDDIYVAYDEMDKYAWADVSQAKIERFQISDE